MVLVILRISDSVTDLDRMTDRLAVFEFLLLRSASHSAPGFSLALAAVQLYVTATAEAVPVASHHSFSRCEPD